MITIPEPCSEDWNRMQAVDHVHRHCDSCAKNVIDFTSMSDDELVIFLRNRNEKMCGRFRADQLHKPYRKIPEPKHTSNWWKAAMLLPLSLFAKSGKAQQDSVVKNDSLVVTQDSVAMSPDSALIAMDSLSVPVDTTQTASDSAAQSVDPSLIVHEPSLQTVIVFSHETSVYGWAVLGGFAPPPPEEIISGYVGENLCTQPNAVPYTWWRTPFPWLQRYLRKQEPVISQPDPTIPLNETDPVAAANTVPPSTNTVDAPWYSVLIPVPFRRRKTKTDR